MNSSRGHVYEGGQVSGRSQPHRLLISEQLSIARGCRDRAGTCLCALWKGTHLVFLEGRCHMVIFFLGLRGGERVRKEEGLCRFRLLPRTALCLLQNVSLVAELWDF